MILMIDNYDSFTYNLVQELAEISGRQIEVVRNDAGTADELLARRPRAIVISPGTGDPRRRRRQPRSASGPRWTRPSSGSVSGCSRWPRFTAASSSGRRRRSTARPRRSATTVRG